MKESESAIRSIMAKYGLYSEDFSEEVDSITFISLMVDIEDRFDIVIEDETMLISEFANVRSICEYVDAQLKVKKVIPAKSV